jgi:hypothetical protein
MTDYPPIPPTYDGEAGEALSDEREDCGHRGPRGELLCPRVNDLAEARFWIRVLHRRTVRDAEVHVELMRRLAQLEKPWWRRLRRG